MRRPPIARLAVAGALATVAAVPIAAYRFALTYRSRAGFPARRPLLQNPEDLALRYRPVTVASSAGRLPGWFVPARDGAPGPGVVLVHGWESNRARMLPNAAFLRAAGFHTLMFDVRGHGENGPETLPLTAAEFGADAEAAIEELAGMAEITSVGVIGHSLGGVGAALAAAADARVAALVTISTPADPRMLTRRTFQLAGLRFPGPVAQPLAWLTTRVFLRPRGHGPGDVSARRAVARFGGPVLVIHGTDDEVVPVRHADLLARAAGARVGRPRAVATGVLGNSASAASFARPTVDVLLVEGGHHRWLYEDAGYRSAIASFLAEHLGGPLEPAAAAAAAASVILVRPPDTSGPFSVLAKGTLDSPDAAGDRRIRADSARPAIEADASSSPAPADAPPTPLPSEVT